MAHITRRKGDIETVTNQYGQDGGPRMYQRNELLFIRDNIVTNPELPDIPIEIRKTVRYRGKRGGVKVRSRKRKYKQYVPSVTFGNVRALASKIEELRTSCRFLQEYREACIIALTETWLDSKISNNLLEITNFQLIRHDRNEHSGKSKGGGLAIYINNKWATNVCVKGSLCTPDIEILTVSIRPFYLPRDFTNVYVTTLYIPPDACMENSVGSLQEHVEHLNSEKPDAFHVILGDFNRCVVNRALRNYNQCVSCDTRNQAQLDKFYCNKRNAYQCHQLPPLKNSDHNMIQMIPNYKPKLKQDKPKIIKKIITDDVSIDKLNACFECTDWDMFIEDAAGNVNTLTEVTTSYIHFCTESILTTKSVKIFPNNKPWITPDLRKAILRKHQSYGTEHYTKAQKDLDVMIKAAKLRYKQKVEGLFKENNTKAAWKGLKELTGQSKCNNKEIDIIRELGSADRLNSFYGRFDTRDFSKEREQLKSTLEATVNNTNFELPKNLVQKALNKIQTRKAAGPDGLNTKVLKSCRQSLFYIIHFIFQTSLATCTFPACWKAGEIVPVPKNDCPKTDNELRPVTLTAILAKCLERVFLYIFMPYVADSFDTLQFAYINKRSTDDAACSLLHYITEHLDRKSTNTVRCLFIDYSSAFNCIQPHILIEKLNKMGVPDHMRLWILDYLSQRPQYVRTKHEHSSNLYINTGAPQGCVLSPVLFVLYTNDLQWDSEFTHILKYADDTVVVGLISNDDNENYFKCIDFVSKWCTENYLELNISKTKEMIIDYRRNKSDQSPVIINNSYVQRAQTYKYLGLVIDEKLSFHDHVENQLKKINKRLYCVWVMAKLHIDPELITMFFNSTIISVTMYACSAFYGLINKTLKRELERPRRRACKRCIVATNCSDNDTNYKSKMTTLACKILKDDKHPLRCHYVPLPSGRRYRLPTIRTNRFKNSFVPSSIRLLNNDSLQ